MKGKKLEDRVFRVNSQRMTGRKWLQIARTSFDYWAWNSDWTSTDDGKYGIEFTLSIKKVQED